MRAADPVEFTEWNLLTIGAAMPDAPFYAARCEALIDDFHHAHELAYGFAARDQAVEFVNIGARTFGRLEKPPLSRLPARPAGRPAATRAVVYDIAVRRPTPIYRRDDLAAQQVIEGPAVIEQLDSTTVVFPGDRCTVDAWGNLHLSLMEEAG